MSRYLIVMFPLVLSFLQATNPYALSIVGEEVCPISGKTHALIITDYAEGKNREFFEWYDMHEAQVIFPRSPGEKGSDSFERLMLSDLNELNLMMLTLARTEESTPVWDIFYPRRCSEGILQRFTREIFLSNYRDSLKNRQKSFSTFEGRLKILCYFMERSYGDGHFKDLPESILALLKCDSGPLTPRKLFISQVLLMMPLVLYRDKIRDVEYAYICAESKWDRDLHNQRYFVLKDLMACYQQYMCPVAHYIEFHKNLLLSDPESRAEMLYFWR